MTAKSREEALTDYQRQLGRVLNCAAHAWAYTYSISADEYFLASEDRNTGSTVRFRLICVPSGAKYRDVSLQYLNNRHTRQDVPRNQSDLVVFLYY